MIQFLIIHAHRVIIQIKNMKFLNILRHKSIEHCFIKSFRIKSVIKRELDLHYFDDTKSRSKSRQILMTQSSSFFPLQSQQSRSRKNCRF